jgi:hypothetical protein
MALNRILNACVALLVAVNCSGHSDARQWHNNMKCQEGFLSKRCEITQGDYLGLSIGMTKEKAFRSICEGEAHKYLINPLFQGASPDDNALHKGSVTCDLESDALKYDGWVFDKKDEPFASVYVQFKEANLVLIGYNYQIFTPL